MRLTAATGWSCRGDHNRDPDPRVWLATGGRRDVVVDGVLVGEPVGDQRRPRRPRRSRPAQRLLSKPPPRTLGNLDIGLGRSELRKVVNWNECACHELPAQERLVGGYRLAELTMRRRERLPVLRTQLLLWMRRCSHRTKCTRTVADQHPAASPPAARWSRLSDGLKERLLLLVGQAVDPHLLVGREGPAA